MRNPIAEHACRFVAFLLCLASNWIHRQPDFEFENDWLQWLSFKSRPNEGIDQNLADNVSWMRNQCYTHQRFLGIYPNGAHAFSSPTLDANGYPTDTLFESVLPRMIVKADEYGIARNFIRWEVIAESNQDHTILGADVMTEVEVAHIAREVLVFGVDGIMEEQSGACYLRAIQTATREPGVIHNSIAGVWWPEAQRALNSSSCQRTYSASTCFLATSSCSQRFCAST